jgi:hypothetical protein
MTPTGKQHVAEKPSLWSEHDWTVVPGMEPHGDPVAHVGVEPQPAPLELEELMPPEPLELEDTPPLDPLVELPPLLPPLTHVSVSTSVMQTGLPAG